MCGFGMKAKPQWKRRRRACAGYTLPLRLVHKLDKLLEPINGGTLVANIEILLANITKLLTLGAVVFFHT